MTKDEALKLALEALESGVITTAGRIAWTEYDSCLISDAVTAIKETLAQPAQEPVATISITRHGSRTTIDNHFEDCVRDWPEGEYKLVLAPPVSVQRQWVGLTDEEIDAVCEPLGFAQLSPREVARAIEAKLKEKNK